jgi:hypothetical protein
MPYSITTRDGITIDNIPDEMPADSPQLKERVAKIRGASTPKPDADVSAPSGGVAMGLRDPVDAGAQLLRRIVPEGAAKAVDTFGNWLADKGLPVARSDGVEGVDKIVNEVNRGYEDARKARGEDGFDGKRLVGNLVNPVNYVGGGSVAAARTIPQLAIAGAKAGAVSGALQPVVGERAQDEFWESKGEQAGMGAVAGAVFTPVASKVGEKVAKGVSGMVERARPAPTDNQIRIAVNNTFVSQGMTPADVPEAVLQSVRRQVDDALRSGRRLNPQELVRRAQFEAVGLTDNAAPTAAQLSRNPTEYANEVNLAQVRIRTPQGEGNPLADRFNAQNRRLQEVFDQAGAQGATDRVTAGQTVMDALRRSDEPVKAGVDDAYRAARSMTGGRAAELDRAAFSQTANRTLDEGMLGRFVPPEVRNTLNDVSDGTMPFTVEAAEQFDSIMSAAQRRFGTGSPEHLAISRIRQALHDAPFMPAQPAAFDAAAAGRAAAGDAARTVDDGVQDVTARMVRPPALPGPGSRAVSTGAEFDVPPSRASRALGPALPPGAGPIDEGAAAREAFAQARRAARDRFATIEATPALRAALDEEAPDKFVQNFILNANVRDVQAMRGVLGNSPEALSQARAQIADHLKRAAFGANLSGDKAFAPERYQNTLRALGRQKLEVFFSPAEIVRMNLAARVASDINTAPAGSVPNRSGTGGALMNLLSRIAESPIARQVPGARMIANQVGEIRSERAINQALNPVPPQPPRELSPEAVRALQLFFTPAGVAGGVLGGSSVN